MSYIAFIYASTFIAFEAFKKRPRNRVKTQRFLAKETICTILRCKLSYGIELILKFFKIVFHMLPSKYNSDWTARPDIQ